jgi:hypothetical protein
LHLTAERKEARFQYLQIAAYPDRINPGGLARRQLRASGIALDQGENNSDRVNLA